MANQPKKYTKFVATAATATLVASAIVPVASAAGFSDVAETNSHAVNINALVDAGIIQGYPDGTFKPNQELTRGQVVKMLGKWVEAQGFEIPADYASKARFNDIKVDAKDQELVKYAALVADTGVFNGSNGALNASGKITRENMALVLDRAFKAINDTTLVELATEIEDVKVADLATAKAEAREAIQALRDLGITVVENFNPKNTVTRGQFASFLNKTINTDAVVELTVKEAVAVDAKTLSVTLSDDTKHTVKLEKALEANEATEVTFTINEKEYTAKVTYVVKELAVSSVSAANAAELVVKFNNPVKASTVVESNGTLVNGVFSITSLSTDGVTAATVTSADSLKATLSEDGKSLTIRVAAGEKFEGQYAFTIANNTVVAKEDAKNKLAAYSTTFTAKDSVRPALVGVSYTDTHTAVVEFSEPIVKDSTFALSAARVDGKELQAASKAVLTSSQFVIDSTNPRKATISLAGLDAKDFDAEIKLSFVGLTDFAGNLVSPNPVSTVVKLDTSNKEEAQVVSIKKVGTLELEITFDQALKTKPAVKIGATTVDAADVSINKKDSKVVTVKIANTITGLKDVTISDFVGINNVTGKTVTKIVNFDADIVAPKVVSSAVEKINGKEYLVVTYDEDVIVPTASVALTGSKVVNYVTSALTSADTVDVTLYDETATKSNKVKIELTDLVAADYTVELAEGLVKDLFNNNSVKKEVKFTRTANDSEFDVINVSPTADNNVLEVNFDVEVDPASALNTANYVVEGAKVDKVELTKNSGTATVKVTLAKNSNEFSGLHFVTVSGVKTATGHAMKAFAANVDIDENVVPTVAKLEVTSTEQLKVTFSENVNVTGTANFDVYVGTVKVDASTVAVSNTNELVITLDNALTTADKDKTITVKPATTINVEDLKGNKLDFTEATATVSALNL
ncbi:S-layer homology domain-containing protein [Solibacillus sp. FSL W7-1324]|uniref:S-layer homology domain-containing protein n=1 Tax=Solibacillus sp. FSL W7-1324 TaxID=2921701 RepID=UPI0030F60577